MGSPLNMQTLIRLADKEVEQKVADFGALPLDIKASLERQMADRRKEVVDAAAEEIVNLLGIKDAFLTANVQRISKLNEEITALTKLNEQVAKQTAYGLQTQNFLPLAKQLGQMVGTTKVELLKIPADWAPAAPAAPVAATASAAATSASV